MPIEPSITVSDLETPQKQVHKKKKSIVVTPRIGKSTNLQELGTEPETKEATTEIIEDKSRTKNENE